MSGGVVSASFAAVFAVYLAGYIRTESAAARFASQIAERRPAYHPSDAVVAPPEPQIPESIPQSAPQPKARLSEPRPRVEIAPPPAVKPSEPASDVAPAQPSEPQI